MTSGLVLYDNLDSTNALKVRFLLAELGIDAEKRELALWEPRPDGYQDVHPFGLIPTLIDGDLTVTESNTALRYLAEREGRDDLRGADPRRRARIDGLMDSLSLEVRPALWGVEEFAVYGNPVDAHEQTARRAALVAAVSAFDKLLDPDGPYAAGEFSIADCAIGGRAKHIAKLGLPEDVAPRLQRAVAATHAREAYRAALV